MVRILDLEHIANLVHVVDLYHVVQVVHVEDLEHVAQATHFVQAAPVVHVLMGVVSFEMSLAETPLNPERKKEILKKCSGFSL